MRIVIFNEWMNQQWGIDDVETCPHTDLEFNLCSDYCERHTIKRIRTGWNTKIELFSLVYFRKIVDDVGDDWSISLFSKSCLLRVDDLNQKRVYSEINWESPESFITHFYYRHQFQKRVKTVSCFDRRTKKSIDNPDSIWKRRSYDVWCVRNKYTLLRGLNAVRELMRWKIPETSRRLIER